MVDDDEAAALWDVGERVLLAGTVRRAFQGFVAVKLDALDRVIVVSSDYLFEARALGEEEPGFDQEFDLGH